MDNAANNIEAKSKSLKDLLKGRHYKVGYFQREYKWKRDNIENLIIDLERSFCSNWVNTHKQSDVADYDKYYMGPVVFFQDKAAFSIVDGQQRLTSFTLLMIFLNHKLDSVLKEKNKLIEYIYSDFYGTEGYNFNIEERVNILDFLFKGVQFDEAILENESCVSLLNRYEDIEELFPTSLLDKDVLPLFVSWVTEKLVFIEIMTQTSDSAYTIFETMNDRGLNLTPTEMLKSYLLSKSGDDKKIKDLDVIWKNKIANLKKFYAEADLDFFRDWLRAKYAVSIRTSEKGASNEDFEKIGTRFHSWLQENSLKVLGLASGTDYYFFVQSDFNFFTDVYLTLLSLEYTEDSHEHRIRLMSYKGISHSLMFPFMLAPIQKTDEAIVVNDKIDVCAAFLDSFAVFRLLLSDPITHSSIRNAIYLKIKEIRNVATDVLFERLRKEIGDYKARFLEEVTYLPAQTSHAKYLLARLYKNRHPEVPFESLFFLRRKDSYVMYQFFTFSDVGEDVKGIPHALREIFVNSLTSYCLVPKSMVSDLDGLQLPKRIEKLIKGGYILEYEKVVDANMQNMQVFFLERNKRMKEHVINLWKV